MYIIIFKDLRYHSPLDACVQTNWRGMPEIAACYSVGESALNIFYGIFYQGFHVLLFGSVVEVVFECKHI